MANTRDYFIPGIFAGSGTTTIPAEPVQGTTYRNDTITPTNYQEGWPFDQIVDSATFNEVMFNYSSLLNDVDKNGIVGWSENVDYASGAVARGSDGVIYRAIGVSGPSSTVRDPISEPTFWEIFGASGDAIIAWDSGTDYTNPVLVYGSDNRLYISQQDSGPSGVGAQNPTTDSGTYWRVLDNSFAYEYAHFQKQTPQGTNGAAFSSGTVTREINTVIENDIDGLSLASNTLSFPAGTYYIEAGFQYDNGGNAAAIDIYNSTDGAILSLGLVFDAFPGDTTTMTVSGRFTLSTAKDVVVRQYSASSGVEGNETVNITGRPEVWADLRVWKVR